MGFDRRAACVTWTVFLITLLIFLVYQMRHALLLVIVAVFLSYMVSPLVDLVERRKPPHVSRGASVALVFLVVLTIAGSLVFFVGSQVVEQAARLGQRLPDMLQQQDSWLHRPVPTWIAPYRDRVVSGIRDQLNASVNQIGPLLRQAGTQAFAVVGNLLYIVVVPILSFLLLKDGPAMRDDLLYWIGRGQSRTLWSGILDDLDFLLAKYMRALLFLSLATFVVDTIFFQIIGMPYGILLAGIAAVLEFIPVVGPLTAAALAVAVALLNGFPHIVWLVVFFGVYRLFQDYVLSPHLMSEGVEIHPLLVIFGILAGEQVAGIWGMFLSIPVIAALRIVAIRLRRLRLSQQTPKLVQT